MSYLSILEYIHTLSKLYFKASKKEKSSMLNHAVQITGFNRKSLIRKLKKSSELINRKKKCGAKAKYPQEMLLPHIECIWLAMGRISAKRMKAGLSEWLPDYHENDVNNHVKYLLQEMSFSTLERLLKKISLKATGKMSSCRKPSR